MAATEWIHTGHPFWIQAMKATTKLQVHIPTPLYERLREVTRSSEFEVRGNNGKMAKVVAIALAKYLNLEQKKEFTIDEL